MISIIIVETIHYTTARLISERYQLLKRRCVVGVSLLAQFDGGQLRDETAALVVDYNSQKKKFATNLAFMECLSLDLPLLFKAINNVLVSPSDLMRKTLENNHQRHGPNGDQEKVVLTFTVQYFRPGFNLNTRRAAGTTMRFFLSYGGGTPSKSLRRSIAAAPRAVLCGIIPRMALKRILDGAR